MMLSPDMRLALLELTHLLEKLARCPRPAFLDILDPVDAESCTRMDAIVMLTLTQARALLDSGDAAPIEAHPAKMLPSAGLGHLIHARHLARASKDPFSVRRPRA